MFLRTRDNRSTPVPEAAPPQLDTGDATVGQQRGPAG